jgi:hypothetical protein
MLVGVAFFRGPLCPEQQFSFHRRSTFNEFLAKSGKNGLLENVHRSGHRSITEVRASMFLRKLFLQPLRALRARETKSSPSCDGRVCDCDAIFDPHQLAYNAMVGWISTILYFAGR